MIMLTLTTAVWGWEKLTSIYVAHRRLSSLLQDPCAEDGTAE